MMMLTILTILSLLVMISAPFLLFIGIRRAVNNENNKSLNLECILLSIGAFIIWLWIVNLVSSF